MRPTLLITIGLALAAVRGESAGTPAPIAQWSGPHGGGDRPNTRVLRQRSEWDAFWVAVHREPPRPFDPERELAVAIGLGERRTAGYTAEVISAAERNGRLVITYREHAPDSGAIVAQVLTAPWVVAVLPRSDLPVVFQATVAAPRPRDR